MRTDTGFSQQLDGERLGKQLANVRYVMLGAGKEGWWMTLNEIQHWCGYPEASISARLRELRSLGYVVDKRRRGEAKRGIWEYRCTKPVLEQQRLAFSIATATRNSA